MKLRGTGHAQSTPSWRRDFATGAIVWVLIHVGGWALRAGSVRPRLGELKILYCLAGTGAVDSYLVGQARSLLLALHVLLAVALGGLLTAGLTRLMDSMLRAGLVSMVLALLLQIFFFLPIAP